MDPKLKLTTEVGHNLKGLHEIYSIREFQCHQHGQGRNGPTKPQICIHLFFRISTPPKNVHN